MESREALRNLTATALCPDGEIELDWAALVLAATEYPKLDIAQEIAVLDSLAAGAARRIGFSRDPMFCVNTLSDYLFREMGFEGNEDEYYDPRNSYLNEVITRRLGIPITLSLVYIEVGRRLGVPLLGVGMPGHFLVRHRDVEDLFVDPFHGGILLTENECAERVRQLNDIEIGWDRRYLNPVGNKEFITRMVRNLKGAYLARQDYARGLRMIDWILTAHPELAQERRDSGIVSYHLGDYARALDDLRTYLESSSPIPDAELIRGFIDRIEDLDSE